MKYARIFGKEQDDFTRYWLSLSTEKLDAKGRRTGEYLNATMPVRLSKDAARTWDEIAVKTKNKHIRQALCEVTSCWLKVLPGKDQDVVGLFIDELKEQED